MMIWHGSTVPVHPTNTRGAEDLYARHAGQLLSPAAFSNVKMGDENEDEGQCWPVPMVLLLEGTLWDLAGDAGLQDTYEHLSSSISMRRVKQKKAQRTSLLDLDIGGVGWMTFACSADDRTTIHKRQMILEEARVRIWGHPALGAPTVRPPLIPLGAAQLKRNEWTTL